MCAVTVHVDNVVAADVPVSEREKFPEGTAAAVSFSATAELALPLMTTLA